jgi:alkanesulfonate monooxygenase SsuD/methylene tetrahydromethanopterin reductase-like flavin-dependent oxidoreductase (luciferase family)
VELLKRAWAGGPLAFKSKFRPEMKDLPILPPIYQKPHPPIWVACFLSPESFDWTAQGGYNLLYVAYHADHPVAVERIGWYRDALKRHGRRVEDHEVACAYHAHFLERADDARLKSIVDKPMAEYAAAGVEASRKPPDPTAYKGYGAREKGQKELGFEVYFPGRVLMGSPDQALARIAELKAAGITQVAMIVDFGSLAQKEIMRSLEIFGREVLPRAKDLKAAAE